MNVLAEGLVIAGACILLGAMIPVRQLVAQLPSGQVRRRWYTLTALILVFIAGYVGYIAVFWELATTWLDLIVPGVFFLGAGFVWLVSTLSLQTAMDVRRVALLEHENITDPLTGIYNRRYLDRRLNEEFARARRYASPLSVLLLDIDRFKHVNDTYGHPVGDLVLNYLGKLLLHAIRESDILARYGGEEFLLIAANTTASTAIALAERLRQHVETHALVLTSEPSQRQEIRISVSIGVASLSHQVFDSTELLVNADQALYCAKQAGRNRVSLYHADALVTVSYESTA
ncbi:MAG: GGDEF domain-containing protein [Chloroflexi bacterium]|nr:GGDEF domain-containing protein [Chloroflexota bacterium]